MTTRSRPDPRRPSAPSCSYAGAPIGEAAIPARPVRGPCSREELHSRMLNKEVGSDLWPFARHERIGHRRAPGRYLIHFPTPIFFFFVFSRTGGRGRRRARLGVRSLVDRRSARCARCAHCVLMGHPGPPRRPPWGIRALGDELAAYWPAGKIGDEFRRIPGWARRVGPGHLERPAIIRVTRGAASTRSSQIHAVHPRDGAPGSGRAPVAHPRAARTREMSAPRRLVGRSAGPDPRTNDVLSRVK